MTANGLAPRPPPKAVGRSGRWGGRRCKQPGSEISQPPSLLLSLRDLEASRPLDHLQRSLEILSICNKKNAHYQSGTSDPLTAVNRHVSPQLQHVENFLCEFRNRLARSGHPWSGIGKGLNSTPLAATAASLSRPGSASRCARALPGSGYPPCARNESVVLPQGKYSGKP
jgi:hypothetical protein